MLSGIYFGKNSSKKEDALVIQYSSENGGDGLVFRASTLQSVDLGFISQVE